MKVFDKSFSNYSYGAGQHVTLSAGIGTADSTDLFLGTHLASFSMITCPLLLDITLLIISRYYVILSKPAVPNSGNYFHLQVTLEDKLSVSQFELNRLKKTEEGSPTGHFVQHGGFIVFFSQCLYCT